MTATMLTATIAHYETAAEGANDKGAWKRTAVILAQPNADLTGTVEVVEADTFLDCPPVGTTVKVVIDTNKRIVGQQVYENRKITRFIPVV